MLLRVELQTLCNALGFVTVLLRQDKPAENSDETARVIATLIENFCRLHASGPAADRTAAFELHQHMAAAIAGIMQKNGFCDPRDLRAKGFTPEEIENAWPMARALAQTMLDIKDA